MNTFPDLGKSFKMLKIRMELDKVPMETLIGFAIHCGLKEISVNRVVHMIKEQAKDNREMMANVIGEDLLREIESV